VDLDRHRTLHDEPSFRWCFDNTDSVTDGLTSFPTGQHRRWDAYVAAAWRFPGSPTIRIDGRDVDPSYADPGDYTPRCRIYWTADGLRGLPERGWVEEALRRAGR
jgi:hypothetical protein